MFEIGNILRNEGEWDFNSIGSLMIFSYVEERYWNSICDL